MMVVFSKFYPYLPPHPPESLTESLKKKHPKDNQEKELGGRSQKKIQKEALRTDEGTKLSANQNRATKKRTQRARL